MNFNKTYKGVFWIPSEQENHKNGLLKFSNEIVYVDLFGSFDKDPLNIKSKKRKEVFSIFGILDNGNCCILNNCQLSTTGGMEGFLGTLINCDYVFYSSNRNLIEKKIQFSMIEFSLNTLFHWGGQNSIESNNNSENKISLSYKEPTNSELLFSNVMYELNLEHNTLIPITTNNKKILIEQDTSLIVHLKSCENFLEVFNFIDCVHDLFILFNADKVELNNSFKYTTTDNEEYYFCFSNRKRFKISKGFQQHEFGNLFTLKELKDLVDISELFTLWFTICETLKYPIELMTKCLSDISLNNQHKFMNLMYALEYMHGKDLNNEITNTYYHKKDDELIREIENLITEKNRINTQNFLGKLRARLENNRKLNEKFKAFFIQLNIPVLELFKENYEVFIDKIVNTRNHFAHLNEKEPRIVIDELQLYNLKLEAILLFIFYIKLGLPSEEIKRKIRMHDRFRKVII